MGYVSVYVGEDGKRIDIDAYGEAMSRDQAAKFVDSITKKVKAEFEKAGKRVAKVAKKVAKKESK